LLWQTIRKKASEEIISKISQTQSLPHHRTHVSTIWGKDHRCNQILLGVKKHDIAGCDEIRPEMPKALNQKTSCLAYLCVSSRCCETIEPKPNDPNAVFVLLLALQNTYCCSSKFWRILRSKGKTSTHVLSSSRNHATRFIVKSFGECCGSTMLTDICYWPSNHKVRSCEIQKDPNVESLLCLCHVSRKSRKVWKGKSCWLHPRESGPEVVQGPKAVTTSPTWFSSPLVYRQQNYLKSVK